MTKKNDLSLYNHAKQIGLFIAQVSVHLTPEEFSDALNAVPPLTSVKALHNYWSTFASRFIGHDEYDDIVNS